MKTKKQSEEKLAGHTPGPWDTSRDAVPPGHVQITVYSVETGHRVATVFDREENACLIAASPELLQALKDTLTICLTRGQALGLDDQGPVLDYAREQISKAERKTP